MKSIRSIFFLLAVVSLSLAAPVAKAQKIIMANYADTVSGNATKYYPAPVQADLFYGSMSIYVDHITGSTDSTMVFIQGSHDGSTWINLGATTYAAQVNVGDAAPTTFKSFKVYTTDAGNVWMFTDRMTLPYYRFAVQHWATGTVRVKGWLYKKK